MTTTPQEEAPSILPLGSDQPGLLQKHGYPLNLEVAEAA